MMSFLVPALVLLVIVILLLIKPFIVSKGVESTSRRQMNAVIYQEELEKLAAELAAKRIDDQEYEISHAELRQRLFQDAQVEDDKAIMGSSKKVIIGLCIFVVLLSSGLYLMLGDAFRVAQINQDKPMTQAGVEQMVADFALKMEKDPNNLKGWAMLARSYRILGRNEDAAKAFARSGNFINDDPELLAEYADVLVGTANGNFAGKPQQLLQQALKLDPNNLLALWLSGTAAYTVGNYLSAVQTWEKLAKLLPPGSDEARAITGSIEDARSKGGITVKPAATGKSISGEIELSAELRSKVKPGDTLMVIARQPGERMPVAVLKVPVSQIPFSFVLDDSLAMNPDKRISQLSEATIEARISKSGMAKAEAGDLFSAAQTVKLGSSKVRVLINQVYP